MFKKLMNKKLVKNEKGLTLVELLAVIVILAIVAAIAVPAIGNVIENSRYKAAKADAITVLNAANIYFTEKSDKTTVNVATLKKQGYLEDFGTITVGAEGDTTANIVEKVTDGGNKFTGSAKYSDVTVTFTGATIKTITEDVRSAKEARGTDAGKEITVPKK
ncbi:prepilin-type N-terminal cleavage/methylation domain-containing protein [Lysinibacillus sp. BF-4]|uniref:prepilin-type N-terminal cleavage/methylation domain-containing protein n=1 Tax=Lysinibacillus sp. BF-4 TaxID=1473546 RepID=UPI0009DD8ED6|nr:prepilin-type N-terminal cleavage/methylation domain-containing protein [Lysinibacillus sp. BF-4]